MYLLKSSRINLSCLRTSNKQICYLTKEGDLYLNEIKIGTKISTCGYFFEPEYFLFSDENYLENKVVNLLNGQVISIGKIHLQFRLENGDFVAIERTKTGKSLLIFSVYTFDRKILVTNFELGVRLLIRNTLIINDGVTCLKLLSLSIGEYIWEIHLTRVLDLNSGDKIQITREIVLVGDNLWVPYFVNRESALLAININTGQITWKSPQNLAIEAYNIKQISDRENLFSLFGIYNRSNPISPYVEIDGTNGRILREGIVESLFSEGLIVSKWLYESNKIYFTARKDMLTTTHIGVLDYRTLALLWYSEVPGRKGDLKDLQVSQNKLYVLDAAGTLHIFEETDDTGSESEPVKIEIRQESPKTSRFASSVFDLDVSDIPFFRDYPFGVLSVEVTGSYALAIPSILAAIELLTGETIEILEYQPNDIDLRISCRIMNTVLTFDTTSNQLSIPQAILESVNEVLVNHGSLKKLKEFEPMPPDDFIILTYVTEEIYHRYGEEGYGLWEEYNWDNGGKEWIGVW